MTLTPTHPDDYGRKRGKHDHKIVDLNDRVPDFLTRQDKGWPARAVAELDEQLGAYIDNANREKAVTVETYDEDPPPPREMAPPLEILKFLVRKLTFGDMKKASGEIAKLGEFDAAKLADALHAWATQESHP